MENMKKYIRLILLSLSALVFAFTAYGCGDETEKEPKAEITIIDITDGEAYSSYAYSRFFKLDDELFAVGECIFDEESNMTDMPSKKGFTFGGIYTKENGERRYVIDKNGKNLIDLSELLATAEYYEGQVRYQIYLTIDYTPITYSYVFFGEDGQPYLDESGKQTVVEYNYYTEGLALPVPEKEDYIFSGWVPEGENYTLKYAYGYSNLPDKVSINVYPKFTASPDMPIFISAASDFLKMKDAPDARYRITEDIDLSDIQWTPIDFSGEIDGRGHTVSGISLHSDAGDLALFKSFTGKVKDLKLNVDIESTAGVQVNVGGFAASFSGTCENVEILGSLRADYCNAGGFAGSMTGGTVKGVKNLASVSTITLEGAATLGGIVGKATGGTITECENLGTVTGFCKTGGIVGMIQDNAFTLTYSKNSGNVTGRDSVGGIVGFLTIDKDLFKEDVDRFNLSNIENIAEVKGSNNVGGVVGYIYNYYYRNDVDGKTYLIDLLKWTNSGTVRGNECVGGVLGQIYLHINQFYTEPQNLSFKATDFVNSGDVFGESSVGGNIGYAYTDGTISKVVRSSSSGAITAEHTVGGLFGYLDNVAIESCTNTGAKIYATGYYINDNFFYSRVGGFAGSAYSISNCTNEADIIYESKGGYIGGLAGYSDGTLSYCTNLGNITAEGASFVGGIVGYLKAASNFSTSELTNEGKISAASYVGGILGFFLCTPYEYLNDVVYEAHLSDFTNKGEIISASGFAGGCIGKVDGHMTFKFNGSGCVHVILSDMKNYASVTSTIESAVGGIVGYATSDSTQSILENYNCTGQLNGEDVIKDMLIGEKVNFSVLN